MRCGVYSITNLNDGKIYIGSGARIEERWRKHRELLRGNRHHNPHLQRAWNLHGEASFAFEVVIECANEKTLVAEQMVLDSYFGNRERQSIYNVSRYATAAAKGRKLSEETKAKMRVSQRARGPRSPETRLRMSMAQVGRHVRPETCLRISASKSGERHPNWGKHLSEGTRRKISEAQRGRQFTDQHLANLRAAHRNRRKEWRVTSSSGLVP